MHFFEFWLLHSCNGNPGTTTTGYELKGWGWYPAGQENMWKALELTDVSLAGGGSLLSSATVNPFVFSEGCAMFF